MNYYEARQRSTDGRWDWTCMNDGKVWRSGPCRDHEDGHATAEDAERHYWEDQMANLRERDGEAHYMCAFEGCEVLTSKSLERFHGLESSHLCDDHRTREVYERLHPFKPGIQITSSW